MSTVKQTVEVVTLNTLDDEENSCASSVPKDAENIQKLSSQNNIISNSIMEHGRIRESSSKKMFFMPRDALVNSQPLQGRPFECEFCLRRFSQKQTLRNHLTTHTGLRPFSCKFCNKTFTQPNALKRHTALHTEDKKEFSCNVCKLSFRQVNNLKRHQKLHSPDAALSFKCEICLRQFARKDGLERHAKKHLSKQEMFFCGFCEKSFASPMTHARHEQNHRKNGEEKAKCQQCRGSFVRKPTKNQTAPSKQDFPPSSGDKVPSSNEIASSNKLSSSEKDHSENVCPSCKSKPNERNVRLEICYICRMEFASKAKLRTHTELEHMDKVSNFTCELCGVSFVTRSHLENHCLVHRNEKNGLMANFDVYQCHYCRLLFTNRESIIRHVRWHEKKLPHNIVREKKKVSQNKHEVEPKEVGSYSLDKELDFNDSAVEMEFRSYVVKEKEKQSRNVYPTECDVPTEEIRIEDFTDENLYIHDIETKSYSEEILSDSQVEDSKDSNPLIKNETIKEEKDIDVEFDESYYPSPKNDRTRNVQNEFDISNSKRSIFDDDTIKEEEEVTLTLGSEQIKLIKVTPMEHFVHENNETILKDSSTDPLAIKIMEEFEDRRFVEDTVNESIETIHDHNDGSYEDYNNEQFTINTETDETSEVDSELIRSETFTEDMDDENSVKSIYTFNSEFGKNSVKSINTFSNEVGKNSTVSSMSILTGISSNLPKEISFANLSKEIRDMIDFDGSYEIDVSSNKKCTESNEISTSTLVYSMKKLKESTLSNELIDDMVFDLLNNGCSENNPINVVYEDNKPIGIVYENEETIEVIQHVEADNSVNEELDIKHAQTMGNDKQLDENSVDMMHNAESVISGNENVEMIHEDHERNETVEMMHEEDKGDIEIQYEVTDHKLEVLQQYETDEKIVHDQSEDDTVAADEETEDIIDQETNVTDQEDSEQKFVLLEVPDKDLMFLLDERTTSAPNSPQDIVDDEFEHFNDTIDDTNETTEREKDANDSKSEEMINSIGNVKLKRPSRNVIKHDNIEIPDEMLYHLSKVNIKKSRTDPKTSTKNFNSDLSAKKNSQKKSMLKSGKNKSQVENLKDDVFEEVYVYLDDENKGDREEDRSFFCYVCKKSYTNKNSLKRHFRTTHLTNNDKISCSLCDKTFKAKDALQKHVRSLHAPHQFKCEFCEKTFNRKDALASHARLHAAEKPFECETCGAKFTQKQNLYAHKLKHRDKKHICQYCDKTFYTKQLRDKHHLTHTNERSFQCTMCNMMFKQKNHLQNHYLVHAGNTIHKSFKTFKCNDCSAIFTRKASLQRHTVRHLGIKREKFVCAHCGKVMNHRVTLEKHLKNKVCTKRIIVRTENHFLENKGLFILPH